MSFWELLALVSAMATILGVFLTIYALINNRTLKEESRNTREMIQEESRNTRDMIKEESGNTRELLDKIDQRQAEARKEMAEALKAISQLIVVEGEKTRQTIKV